MALYCFRTLFAALFLGLLFAIVIMCMNEAYRENISTLQNGLIILSYVLALPLICLLCFLFDSEMFGFWDHAVVYVLCGMYCLLEVLIFAKHKF